MKKWCHSLVVLFGSLISYAQNPETMAHRFTNDLIHESSPYLLQHAHNPVNWHAWKPQVLKKAQQEDKLLLISIGYAACHWCHVMERECFEDEEVAQTMNRHFINIKVDREERPDVDHIYMDALQMMTGQGGWPLNIVALPDGRPFWGATYVKKEQWIRALEQLAGMYRKEPEKLIKYAEDLAAGIRQINIIENTPAETIISPDELWETIKNWYRFFDLKRGGYNRAPKFMMPGNLDFLLHYGWASENSAIEKYVDLTLTKMAYGGIYDQLGGGFARYSVDTKWHVPHFEKMLYDNALLISVYAKAYAVQENQLYKQVVRETIDFLTRELMDPDGGFYSSLDADSDNKAGELEEGAFYVWTEVELKQLLGDRYPIFKDYYNINSYGHWEHGNYVLIRDYSDEELAEKHHIQVAQLLQMIDESKKLLFEARKQRDRPGLDDKILCSWNGLALKALTDAYRYLGEKLYLELALKNAAFIETYFLQENSLLLHNYKDGKATITGYLEDYASVIDGLIGLYEVSFDEKWIRLARKLTDRCLEDYYDENSSLFYFSSKKEEYIIRRTLETGDNVIPASNSMMCKNLFKLSRLLLDPGYEEAALAMISRMQERILAHPESHANWMHLLLYLQNPFYEVAVVGDEAEETRKSLQSNYLPNSVFAGTGQSGELQLVQDRYTEGKTQIYICLQGSCKLPVTSVSESLELLNTSPKTKN